MEPNAVNEVCICYFYDWKSSGSFGIPKGLVFSQPVYLKRLEDDSLVWTPFKEFPMPNIPMEIFENLIYTAKHLVEKIPCQIWIQCFKNIDNSGIEMDETNWINITIIAAIKLQFSPNNWNN